MNMRFVDLHCDTLLEMYSKTEIWRSWTGASTLPRCGRAGR